jgi:hypothetical protein
VTRALAAAGAAGLAVLLAGCGGSADRTLARVGDQQVTQSQVDLLISRAREEARNERQDFPDADSPVYRELQRQALAALVYRARVEVAARRLGIAVTDAEARANAGLKGPRHKELPELVFERAIGAVGLEEGKDEESALRLSETKLQLTLAALERKLGADGVKPWLDRTVPTVRVRFS